MRKAKKPGLREVARKGDVVTLQLNLDPKTAFVLHEIAKIAEEPPDVVSKIMIAIEAYRLLGPRPPEKKP